jgi:hypothetical protein
MKAPGAQVRRSPALIAVCSFWYSAGQPFGFLGRQSVMHQPGEIGDDLIARFEQQSNRGMRGKGKHKKRGIVFFSQVEKKTPNDFKLTPETKLASSNHYPS